MNVSSLPLLESLFIRAVVYNVTRSSIKSFYQPNE